MYQRVEYITHRKQSIHLQVQQNLIYFRKTIHTGRPTTFSAGRSRCDLTWALRTAFSILISFPTLHPLFSSSSKSSHHGSPSMSLIPPLLSPSIPPLAMSTTLLLPHRASPPRIMRCDGCGRMLRPRAGAVMVARCD